MNWLTKKCWEHTKKLEGGFTIDEGGATKFGICWKYDSVELIKLGYTSEDRVKDLTEEDAIKIFEATYIIKWRFSLLSELPETMMRALDLAFHEGKYGWMSVQMTINDLLGSGLKVDGACGPMTEKAIQNLIDYSKAGADNALTDAGIAAILNTHKVDLYNQIFEEEYAAKDPRAFRKLNSALRRTI